MALPGFFQRIFGTNKGAPSAPATPAAPSLKQNLAPVVEMSLKFEGFRAAPYQDSAGVWTIGIGSTRDLKGDPVAVHTPYVTRAQAEQMHMRDLQVAVGRVELDGIGDLPERWWAVAVSLCNNMGRMSVWGPTLLRMLKAKQWEAATAQLKAYHFAGGRPVLGLRRRRWTEAAYVVGIPLERAYTLAQTKVMTTYDWPAFPTGA